MKKVLAVLLSLCLLAGLCSCSSAPIEVKKFASETEMQEYLQGAWKSTTLDGNEEYNYIFFNGNQVYIYGYSDDLLTEFKDSFVDRIEADGYEAFAALSVTDYVKELETNKLSDSADECVFKHKKGVAVFKDKYKIYAGNDIIHYAGQDYEKLSDIPTYEAAGITQLFIDAHADYVPPLSLCKLTNEEYAKALMELHPETKNFPVAYEDDNEHIFSDTGNSASNGGQYNSILMWTDNTVLFSKRANSTDTYKVILSESSLLIQDTHHRESWETLIADALALFGGAPGLPTPQELIAEFREKGENYVLNPSLFEYSTEIGGIKFEMDEAFAANNNSKLLILRFE